MWPELFRIPFTELTVKSYGTMLVIGFLAAIYVIRRLSKGMGQNPDHITNAALYSLIAGVVGARAFYVVHYWETFKHNQLEIFYVWQGGLELLGGVLLAILVILFYMFYQKLPIRRYLDILAIGLLLALAFGRMGCFLNGCCFGHPTEQFWGVRFPYDSPPYRSQVMPDPARGRGEAYWQLSDEYFTAGIDDTGRYIKAPKMYAQLSSEQRTKLRVEDKYYCKAIHPTQLYSSVSALILCLILYLFWKCGVREEDDNRPIKPIHRPGTTFGLMFVLYGPIRFLIEFIRDDNPYEMWRLTISQLIGAGLFVFGIILMIIFVSVKPKKQH